MLGSSNQVPVPVPVAVTASHSHSTSPSVMAPCRSATANSRLLALQRYMLRGARRAPGSECTEQTQGGMSLGESILSVAPPEVHRCHTSAWMPSLASCSAACQRAHTGQAARESPLRRLEKREGNSSYAQRERAPQCCGPAWRFKGAVPHCRLPPACARVP